ncbi:hypothetical protein BDF14DRAFT_871513 [Spinellus fusiger]|nr:hypothetical protein BDF14DRAFT_871513 [Spinellus fusiger]
MQLSDSRTSLQTRAPWRGVGTATTPLPSSTKELHTKIHSSASSLLLETSTSHSSHKQPRSTNDFSYQRPTVASTSHATLPVHRSVRVEESERPSMLRKRKDPPGTMNRAMASKRPSMATETETPWKRRGECVRVPPRPSHAMNSSAPEETSTSHRLSTLHGFTQREASSFSASHGAKDSALVQRRENTMTEQRKMACLYAKCIQYQYSVVRHQLSIKHQTPLPHVRGHSLSHFLFFLLYVNLKTGRCCYRKRLGRKTKSLRPLD